jgi:lipid A 3-O-deacylase
MNFLKLASSRQTNGIKAISIIAFSICLSLSSQAQAKISEVRFGVFAHNIETNVAKNAGKEDGPDLQVEVLFDSPQWLGFAGSPRPSIVGSLNTQGGLCHPFW